jgi:phosphopantetheinyl transferase
MTNKLLLSPLLSLEQCRELVSKTDWAAALEFVSQTRRQEFLTWRAVLYQWLGRVVDIAYKDGAPTAVGSNINIGVSHTTDMVAVVVSQTPCAVDVERRDRDVSRVAERFFT